MTDKAQNHMKPHVAQWQMPYMGAFFELNTIELHDMGRVFAILKDLHKSVEGQTPYSMTSLYYGAMYPDNTALSSIGGAVAGHIDQAVYAPHERNAYHNTRHLKKVFINCVVLCALHDKLAMEDRQLLRLTDEAKRVLYIAAMAHDIDHDGGSNMVRGVRSDYRLEDIAAAKVARILSAFAQPEGVKSSVRHLIRATDVGAVHKIGLSMDDSEQKLLAMMLCDADVMSSTCIKPTAGYAETYRLSLESGFPIFAEGYKHFTAGLVQEGYGSPSGRLFNERMQVVVSQTLRLLQKHPIRLRKNHSTTRNCLKHVL